VAPRAALTGAGGFIGSHLAAELAAAGWQLVLLGPPALKRRETVALVESGLARWEPVALASAAGSRRALARCDALCHLGYRAPRRRSALGRLGAELAGNVRPTARLLRAAAEVGVGYLVFTSTARVYPAAGLNREDGLLAPADAYALAKLWQEELVRGWSADTRRPAAVLRLTTVFGPGEPVRRAIPRFIRDALLGRPPRLEGDGSAPFAPVDVADVVAAIRTAMEGRARGVFNLGGSPLAVAEAARMVAELCGLGPATAPQPLLRQRPNPLCDTSRAAAELGFRPRPLREGLAREVAWFRSLGPVSDRAGTNAHALSGPSH
jgi:nucleoside-diphosphate-sugar epimerase